MKGFDKLHIKSAVKSHNKMRLDQVHLTSLDFGQVSALYHRSLVPGDNFSIDCSYFSRLAPLVRPTYGKFSFRTMAAFVPFHQVAYDADAFISGKTVYEGSSPDIRKISYTDYITVFLDSAVSITCNATDAFDFTYVNSAGIRIYRMFTNRGRYYYKILTSLGYKFPSNVDLQSSSAWKSVYGTKYLNLLPFLCFVKVYNDYMSQSQRFNTNAITTILHYVRYNKTYSSYYNASTHTLTTAAVLVMLAAIRVGYENDYFTSAWEQPESPIGTIQDISTVTTDTGNDFLIHNTTGVKLTQAVPDSLYQRSLDLLRSFYNFVKRNNYVGSREVQQVFARYGVKPEDYEVNYAHLITTDIQPIQVGDVTAEAQSTNVVLGDYAGKGIMNGGQKVTYHSSDFGMLFILGWVTVTPMNAYGFEREVLKTNALDFYQPDFDGVGVDAISYGEVFADPLIVDPNDHTLDDQVFGFTERYNDMRYARDQITGDFLKYRPDEMNVWHTGRLLNSVRAAGNMVAQSNTMNTLDPVDSEYNRIFSVTAGFVDHFLMTCQFKVNAVRPMLSLNQVPGLGEGDLTVSRNGNEIH